MSLVNENIRFLRKQKGLTQEQLGEKIGIKRSLLGAYEEGRAEPGLDTLLVLAKLFEISVDDLISENISEKGIQQKLIKKDIEGRKLRVLAITVDKDEKENVYLVPQKAAAGYLNGYSDPEYVSELPKFYLPIFNNGTFRAFEIKGDSMLPLASGTIIIGQYVDDWTQVKNDKTYILITKNEGIVYKRVFNELNSSQSFNLVSDNKQYSSYSVHADDVHEIWEAKAFISTQFPDAEMSLEKLTSMVIHLQDELAKVKK